MSTTNSPSTPLNREAWLHALAEKLTPLMRSEAGLTLRPGSYKLSVGFPSTRARALKGGRIGECWHGDRPTKEIFIHPKLGSAVQVAETVLHELIHAALPANVGHKKTFSQAAKKLGILPEGAKPTSTFADPNMRKVLQGICDEIGPYPHEALNTDGMPKQTTRLLKAMCPICGYTVRVTAKWLDEGGAPICPTCDIEMEASDAGEGPSSPLVAVSAVHEYKIPVAKANPKAKTVYDPRWSLQMLREGKSVSWRVIDYGDQLLGVSVPRLTPAESREDALNILEALRDGIMTYKDIEDLEREAEEAEEYQDITAEELERIIEDNDDEEDYLDDEEEEDPDYPEEQPEDDEEYESQQRQREGVVCGTTEPMRFERELGSFQYRWNV
jgi:hypothetical protein